MSILLIGGLDSSGGAGLMRDLAALASLNMGAKVACTAVTAQTERAVTAVLPVPPEGIGAQIAAAGAVSAVKIGMLGTAAAVVAVAEALPDAPMVLDPVIRASSGAVLLAPDGVGTMLTLLVPRARILTPNCGELEVIGRMLGVSGGTSGDEAAIVAALLAMGCGAVLVKGGHRDDPQTCRDMLYTESGRTVFDAPRQGFTLRGTGCHLASAIAGGLARGADLETAVRQAKASICARFADDPRARAQQ